MSNIAIINKIISFSNVDGPGNRCAIFFQACPLSCTFCHNPETINLCCNCGECISVCESQALTLKDGRVVYDQHKCLNCDECIKKCQHLSSPKTQAVSVDELYQQIKPTFPFIRGITVSGGECMKQAPFILEIFKKIKSQNLTCLIDSNGYYDFKEYHELLTLSDGVMLDVKMFDNQLHQKITNESNSTILANLDYLLEQNKLVEVRLIMYPNYHDKNLETIAYVANKVQAKSVIKLIRYRHFGVRLAGIEMFGNEILSDDVMNGYRDWAIKQLATNVVIT